MRDRTSTWFATAAPSLAAVKAMATFIRASSCAPAGEGRGGVEEGRGRGDEEEGGGKGERKMTMARCSMTEEESRGELE